MPRNIGEDPGISYLPEENKVEDLTLRDLFAAFALTGILHDGNPYQLGIRWCAATAYEVADAMLEQRTQSKEQL